MNDQERKGAHASLVAVERLLAPLQIPQQEREALRGYDQPGVETFVVLDVQQIRNVANCFATMAGWGEGDTASKMLIRLKEVLNVMADEIEGTLRIASKEQVYRQFGTDLSFREAFLSVVQVLQARAAAARQVATNDGWSTFEPFWQFAMRVKHQLDHVQEWVRTKPVRDSPGQSQ